MRLTLGQIRAKAETMREVSTRERAQTDFLSFVQYTMPGFKVSWHHRVISHYIEQVVRWIETEGREGIRFLAIHLPPQHSKSELVSRKLPAYLLGRRPSTKIMATSYASDLSTAFANDVRRTIVSPHYRGIFPETIIGGRKAGDIAENKASFFRIKNTGGSLISAGFHGQLTGRPFELGIVDDWIKSDDEARSDAYKRKMEGAYEGNFVTRRTVGWASEILVMTPWRAKSIQDFIVRHWKESGDPYYVLRLPAIQEWDRDNPKRCEMDEREVGEVLWESRFGKKHYEGIRRGTDPIRWAAMYQQSPIDEGGDMFREDDFDNRYIDPPDLGMFDLILQSWDMSFKKEGRSWVVGGIIGILGADYYVLDRDRGHWDFVETCNRVRAMSKRWPLAYTKLVEAKANGIAVVNALRSEVGGFIEIEVNESKPARASQALPVYRAKNVRVPVDSRCSWASGFVAEHLAFPGGDHDDQVDMMTQAINWHRGDGVGWDWMGQAGTV